MQASCANPKTRAVTERKNPVSVEVQARAQSAARGPKAPFQTGPASRLRRGIPGHAELSRGEWPQVPALGEGGRLLDGSPFGDRMLVLKCVSYCSSKVQPPLVQRKNVDTQDVGPEQRKKHNGLRYLSLRGGVASAEDRLPFLNARTLSAGSPQRACTVGGMMFTPCSPCRRPTGLEVNGGGGSRVA